MSFLRFLKENWIWWVAPIVLVLGGLLLLVLLTERGSIAPFIYAIF